MSTTKAKPRKKVNYLNNKDILIEIHKSKNSFCARTDDSYCDYDVIVEDLSEIFKPETIEEARANRIIKMKTKMADAIFAEKGTRVRLSSIDLDESLVDDDYIFRVYTNEHLPSELCDKTGKVIMEKVNFPPFKHYIISDDVKDTAIEVVRSHWKGDFDTGEFSVNHGRITEKLGRMFIMLVKRYGQRGNWRGYTYNDEMQGQALLQLSNFGLKFNEHKSQNPFAYYTTVITNSFTRVLLSEKKGQSVKETLMMESGLMPTFSRQAEVDIQRDKDQQEH